MSRKTIDGLPVISQETYEALIDSSNLSFENNMPEVTARIRKENPRLYDLLNLLTAAAPTTNARNYIQKGIQITYEALRIQSQRNSPKNKKKGDSPEKDSGKKPLENIV